ncbi:hypothetical protein F511_24531 [Dorcoceras hygrometricum]|uniref:Uncharacterized protein n=1 Tax=Dorcoceras hygrometricum TaxID=472368 RepID=A0A2Z7BM26_9LAMI|nr:hypothetical protein F511_24531 [Dorcoceras hygrometricum]
MSTEPDRMQAVHLSKETGRHPDWNSEGMPKLEQLKMSTLDSEGTPELKQHKTNRVQGTSSWLTSLPSDRVQIRSQAQVRRTQLSNQLKDHLGGQLRYTSCFSERLNELEVTLVDGDEEESVCRGYSIDLHRAKLPWKDVS